MMSKWFFFVSSDFEYGLTRMFEMSSRGMTQINVFRKMDEAVKYLMEQATQGIQYINGPCRGRDRIIYGDK